MLQPCFCRMVIHVRPFNSVVSCRLVWGPQDGYMSAESARAYLRDVPEAELHLIEDADHWLLETHFDDALPLIRNFLSRTLH